MIPGILVWIMLLSMILEALFETRTKVEDHRAEALVRLLARIGHRPPDPRDYK